jgi:8-oxo-dGTP pyrophosphatase MutT (NUDIX family)
LKLAVSKNFTKSAWMLPGGRLNVEDQVELGLQREILEETGLKVKDIIPVHTAFWVIEKTPKYSVFFLCHLIGKQDVKISHEHTESKWIKISEIEKISWHNINSKIAIKKSKLLLERGF